MLLELRRLSVPPGQRVLLHEVSGKNLILESWEITDQLVLPMTMEF